MFGNIYDFTYKYHVLTDCATGAPRNGLKHVNHTSILLSSLISSNILGEIILEFLYKFKSSENG
jgi:hypothetical protein